MDSPKKPPPQPPQIATPATGTTASSKEAPTPARIENFLREVLGEALQDLEMFSAAANSSGARPGKKGGPSAEHSMVKDKEQLLDEVTKRTIERISGSTGSVQAKVTSYNAAGIRWAMRRISHFAGAYTAKSNPTPRKQEEGIIEDIMSLAKRVHIAELAHQAGEIRYQLMSEFRRLYGEVIDGKLGGSAYRTQVKALLESTGLFDGDDTGTLANTIKEVALSKTELLKDKLHSNGSSFIRKAGSFDGAGWAAETAFKNAGWPRQGASRAKTSLKRSKRDEFVDQQGILGTQQSEEELVQLAVHGSAPTEEALAHHLTSLYRRFSSNHFSSHEYEIRVRGLLVSLAITLTEDVLDDALLTSAVILSQGPEKSGELAAKKIIRYRRMGHQEK